MTGYRVEVDSLRAFATQVRGLLSEFENGAGGSKVQGQSGVASSAFGTFVEAEALHAKYEEMRYNLSAVLDGLQAEIDDSQRKADLTATNYEEQENETTRHMQVSTDGWSVGGGQTGSPSAGPASRPTYRTGPVSAPSTSAAPNTGDSQQTW